MPERTTLPEPRPDRPSIQPEPRAAEPTPTRRRGRLLAFVIAVVALAGVVWAVAHRQPGKSTPAVHGPDAQARPVPVTTATVARRDVPIYLEGIGNVVALKTVSVKTLVDGQLQEVLFREGQFVHRGDVLAQVDPRPFLAQLHQAEGALTRDQAQLQGAKLNLKRYRDLAAQQLIPDQQADDQEALVGQLEGSVQIDKAQIETARLNLAYARITSPIDGVTGVRIVDPGNIVHPGDANGIVIVTQLDPIAILFTLPQDQLTPVLSELSRGTLGVDVFSRDGSLQLGTGKLALVDNQINQATSTIRLKAIIPNPRHVLWPNQFVNARLHLTTSRGTLVMPATALQRGPNGTFVYVIGADMTASPRPVELAGTQGETAMIASGLQEGERVVVDGQNQLRPGSRVAPRVPGQPGGKAASGAGGGGAR